MSLENLDIHYVYDSDEDDVLNEFLIPVLSEAKEYLRLAGYFSSSTLAVSARGMAQFIENEGRMKLVVGANLNKNDVEAVTEAYRDPELVMEESMIDELSNLEDKFKRDHVEALGWMIANDRLDMKVAIVRKPNGDIIPAEEAQGIFHQKVGIVTDEKGKRLSFSGSDNETAQGWIGNVEEFKVFKEWESDQRKYFEEDINKFQKFWNNESIRVEVKEVPEAVKDELIEIAPEDKSDINIEEWEDKEPEEGKKISLWPHQKEAIEEWENNDKKAVWEMATGTGKTYSALGSVREIEEDCLVVISCPTNPLIEQWQEEIEDFGFDHERIVCSSMNRNWRGELNDAIFDLKYGGKSKVFVLTTHDTLSNEDFVDIVKEEDLQEYLIADEVHGVGSGERRTGLIPEYNYRLGLSATPARWFDEEGTEILFNYFGAVKNEPTYKFSLEEAISTTNPDTGKTYLCPYEYKPQFVELTPDELEDYHQKTKSLVQAYHSAGNKEERDELVQKMASKRSSIIKNAENKYEALEDIIEGLEDMKHTLFYVSPSQIENVQGILNDYNIKQHKITQHEGQKEKEEFGGISERQHLMRNFAEGRYDALVSIKILDEGIDIPATKRAVLMSSTGNPRQYIQRRGRVLRHSSNKHKATIYDIIVVPSLTSKSSDDFFDMERKILQKELKRFKEFSDTALNSRECYGKIEKVERKYNIVT